MSKLKYILGVLAFKMFRPLCSVVEIKVYVGHTDMVRCISPSPCGQWLASGEVYVLLLLLLLFNAVCF